MAQNAEHPTALQANKAPAGQKLQTVAGNSPGMNTPQGGGSDTAADKGQGGGGGVYYDLRLLRENIQIIHHYMHWSSKALVDLRPYYPTFVYHFRKPWILLNQEEAFLFFYSLALSLHFIGITVGFAMKFAVKNEFYDYAIAQFVVEVTMFFLTFLLFLYPRFKCYFYVYIWVCAKAFYWSSILYSIAVHIHPFWRSIEGPLKLAFDMYVTIALLMHSLVDYARLSYVHSVLREIVKEEMKITAELVARDRLGDTFFEDL